MTPVSKSKWLKSLVILSLGFYPLFAQTLLFRSFIAAFNGNELSLGLFFCSWLLWVTGGAVLGRFFAFRQVVRQFGVLLLLFIPAAFLQFYLFQNIRLLLGISSYDLVPLSKLSVIVMIANAPVSILTGFLFIIACSWVDEKIAISKVYILEALGSFCGAIVVTFFLYINVLAETLLVCNSLFLSGNLLVYFLGKARTKKIGLGRFVELCLVLFVLIGSFFVLIMRYDLSWADIENRKQWQHLLPGSQYEGSFMTRNAKYYYGNYEGDFVVTAWNAVVESWPQKEAALSGVAEVLCQNPKARNVLVIGQGVWAEIGQWCELEQVDKVVWLDADPEYPGKIRMLFKDKGVEVSSKLELPAVDARYYLLRCNEKFDVVVLNYPEATTLLMNRYFTQEFFLLVKRVLSEVSVFSVSFAGAENYMGVELAFTGASIFYTLKGVFRNLALKPGENSIFFASDSLMLVEDEGGIVDNYLKVGQVPELFPVEALLASYPAGRIAFQMNRYFSVVKKCPGDFLVNSDEHPKTFLYCLLFNLKKMGFVNLSMSFLIAVFQLLLSLVVAAIVVVVVFRLLYLWSMRRAKGRDVKIGAFDLYFFLLSASFAGMLVNISLICEYQIVFGSVFLNFGLISSLFMIGLFAGGMFSKKYAEYAILRYGAPVAFSVFAGGLAFVPVVKIELVYVVLFFGAGFFSGMFMPLVALCLNEQGVSSIQYVFKLEMLDHFGGALGSVGTAVVLLPVLGIENSLLVVTLLMFGILIVSCLGRVPLEVGNTKRKTFFMRCMRSVMFLGSGIIVYLVIVQFLVSGASVNAAQSKVVADSEIKKFVGGVNAVVKKNRMYKSHVVTYYEVNDLVGERLGYVFFSQDFAPGIKGYGGPIYLMIKVDQSGNVENFQVLHSEETKSFMKRVIKRKKIFLKQNVFRPVNKKLDAVSGATITSDAINEILQKSGKKFFRMIRGGVGTRGTEKRALGVRVDDVDKKSVPAQIRDIDKKKYNRLIDKNRMSSRKASFYKEVD